jgi:hypothetical protein
VERCSTIYLGVTILLLNIYSRLEVKKLYVHLQFARVILRTLSVPFYLSPTNLFLN